MKTLLTESDFVRRLAKILEREFETNKNFREIAVGYGIADLVLTPNYRFRKRTLKHKIPVTDFNSLQILFELQTGVDYTIEDIYLNFSFSSKQAIRKKLGLLIKAGLIEKVSKNAFRKISIEAQLDPIPEVIAIEAKLSDHRGGLIQAKRYQYFADKSFLALPNTIKQRVDLNDFKEANIGLIFFDTENNSIEIIEPKRTNTKIEHKIKTFAQEILIGNFLETNNLK